MSRLNVHVAIACERGGAKGRATFAALALVNGEHRWRIERLPGELTSPEATAEALIRVVGGMVGRGSRGQVWTCLRAATAPDPKLLVGLGLGGFQGRMATLSGLCAAVGVNVAWCGAESPDMAEARAEARAALERWQGETTTAAEVTT